MVRDKIKAINETKQDCTISQEVPYELEYGQLHYALLIHGYMPTNINILI